MLLRERIIRLEGLVDETQKYLTTISKELKRLKTATQETFEKIHIDNAPDLPLEFYNGEEEKGKD